MACVSGECGIWRTKPAGDESVRLPRARLPQRFLGVAGLGPESRKCGRQCPESFTGMPARPAPMILRGTVHHIKIAKERSFFLKEHYACPENAVLARCHKFYTFFVIAYLCLTHSKVSEFFNRFSNTVSNIPKMSLKPLSVDSMTIVGLLCPHTSGSFFSLSLLS
jgi:hypothetical protein